MRFTGFFSTLILLPTIVSANPVAISRRDNSTSDSLSQAATRIMGATIDIGRRFAGFGLDSLNSSSPVVPVMEAWLRALWSQPAFQAFDPIIADTNCTYNLAPLSGFVSVEEYSPGSMAWVSNWMALTANSIIANATNLDLSETEIQMIQNAGKLGAAMSTMLLPTMKYNVDPDAANEPLSFAIWEIAHFASFFEPRQCINDPGVQILGFPNLPIVYLTSPFFVPKNSSQDISNLCPNGRNDTNCVCQTISSNPLAVTVSPAHQCIVGGGSDINAVYLTANSIRLSLDPNERTLQQVNGSIFVGPLSFGFGSK